MTGWSFLTDYSDLSLADSRSTDKKWDGRCLTRTRSGFFVSSTSLYVSGRVGILSWWNRDFFQSCECQVLPFNPRSPHCVFVTPKPGPREVKNESKRVYFNQSEASISRDNQVYVDDLNSSHLLFLKPHKTPTRFISPWHKMTIFWDNTHVQYHFRRMTHGLKVHMGVKFSFSVV